MDYRGIPVPADIEEMLELVTPEDKRRLLIVGAMRTSGIYERTHTTHMNEGVTVFRFTQRSDVDRDTVRDLIREWLIAHYGVVEVEFYQSKHEYQISDVDVKYFHCRATHRK